MNNSYILFEGKSQFDKKRNVVAILTGVTDKSKNGKAGSNMLSVWFLDQDEKPNELVRSGKDHGICNKCPFRLANNGARMCYVNLRTPCSIYAAYKRGNYEMLPSAEILTGRNCRIGAYGDPASVPKKMYDMFLSNCNKITSYTHAWENPRNSYLADFSMASCETPELRDKAKAMGYRTFRIRPTTDNSLLSGEIECPHYKTGITCEKCGLCSGNRLKAKDIAVTVHGAPSMINAFNERYG